jgi:hypothetical protein
MNFNLYKEGQNEEEKVANVLTSCGHSFDDCINTAHGWLGYTIAVTGIGESAR